MCLLTIEKKRIGVPPHYGISGRDGEVMGRAGGRRMGGPVGGLVGSDVGWWVGWLAL